jgi:hypothetical protein
MRVARDCFIWKLRVKIREVKVALESTTIKRKDGFAAMGFHKYTGSKGGHAKYEDLGVMTKGFLEVHEFCRTRQLTMLWKEDLWNAHHLSYLGEEGDFGGEGAKAKIR